jgi:2-desacetyl-2-hydroxyethyl bacteriochlorophyllide A dehydrogenase
MTWTRYGSPDVLRLEDVEKPVPGDNEILIRIHAATVTAGDCETRSFRFPFLLWLPLRIYIGLRKPTRTTILGQELAGEIESAGKDVKPSRIGENVFGFTGLDFGAYAEYICLPGDAVLATKPSNMTHAEAATVPTGGTNALHFLREGKVQRGEKVLINGAGGSIGTFAVQIAKSLGAEVTAVDSTGKLDMLRSIGADRVIDYTREDFTESDESYDVVFDIVGKSSFSRSVRSLKRNGRYLLGNPRPSQMARALWTSTFSSKSVVFAFAGQKTEDLVLLRELIEAGTIKSVIDRRYPLEQTAEAHRYVEGGHKKGHVVIAVAG